MPSPEGNRPHNLDLSSLKPLPKEREPGWSVKKPESQSLQGAKTPDVGAPAAGEGDPAKRLLSPFPEQQVYSSGTRGCFGLTEEEWIKNEEAWKLHRRKES